MEKVCPSTDGRAVKWRSLVSVLLPLLYVATIGQTQDVIRPPPTRRLRLTKPLPHGDATAVK